MMQWKVPGLSGTSVCYVLTIKGKTYSSFLTDIVHKTKSSILTFTRKGGKKMSTNGGTLELRLHGLSTSLFKLSLLSLSVSEPTPWNRFCSFPSLEFLCVILLVRPSIIREKTPNSHFRHRIFIFLPTLYFKLICQGSLGSPI